MVEMLLMKNIMKVSDLEMLALERSYLNLYVSDITSCQLFHLKKAFKLN